MASSSLIHPVDPLQRSTAAPESGEFLRIAKADDEGVNDRSGMKWLHSTDVDPEGDRRRSRNVVVSEN